jgi:serine/threonine-protein kinase
MQHADTLPANPTLGRLLKGQYRIDAELGSGAMGVVFRGTHVGLGKPVAIKMLRSDGFLSREAQERFQREARTASMLVHPGIAQVFDYGIEDGVPYLVMELVDGPELSEIIEGEGPMAPARAVAIMRQLASVLEEAHRHGVVHRDIKPQNIKLMRYTPGGQIYLKVLDFGIAKQVGSETGKLTATGAVIGTPYYMAPEQASGASRKIDGRADQYAAGVVLYEMLTGQVPFSGESLAGVLVSHMTQKPPPLPRQVPEPLRQIVDRLLAKLPEHRFPDCGALDRALQACEAACRDVPPLQRDSVQPAVSQLHKGRGAPAGLAAAAAAVALAAGALIAVLVLGPRLRQPAVAGGGTAERVEPKIEPRIEPKAAEKGGPGPEVQKAGPKAGQKAERPPRPRRGGDEPEQAAPSAPRNPEAAAKLEEAEALFQQKQFQEAIQLAQQSVGVENSVRAWRLITLAHCGRGDLERAKASFHRVPGAARRQVIERCRKFEIELEE